MSPRRTAADTLETKRRIVERSVAVSSVEGLEGLTIGRLAGDLGMSKSGILRHFSTKERLQLAAVEDAAADFGAAVQARARDTAPGLERLLALADAWIDYVAGRRTIGGCFFTAASTEFDGRPGRVRDAIAGWLDAWARALDGELRTAVEAGDLPTGTDRKQVLFELSGTIMGLNQQLLLRGDEAAPGRAHRAVRRILGTDA